MTRLTLCPLKILLAVLSLTCGACGDGAPAHDDDARHDDASVEVSPVDVPTDANRCIDPPFRYVRILDTSTTSSEPDGGAHIDAVALRSGEDIAHATTVEGYQHGGGHPAGPDLDPDRGLGPPEGFDDPQGACLDHDDTVALGGSGGQLTVGLGSCVEPGDTLLVYETRDCDLPAGATLHEIVLSVAVSQSLDGPWTVVGSGAGPVVEITVPDLVPPP